MDFDLTPAQKQFQKEIDSYLRQNVKPDLQEELDQMPEGEGPLFRKFLRQFGSDGWMGVGWPKEYGGQGRSPLEQYLFLDTALGYHRLPIPVLSVMTIGPTIMRFGTDKQKQEFLPAILRGDLIASICYTEPEAGTDAFSIKTTAVKDGDSYILNGQKIFTTCGHYADYYWVSARTDLKTTKPHQGISILMVDSKTPGISMKAQPIMGDFKVNQEFFDNVRVPAECLIGQENMGAMYMMLQLGHERIAMVPHSMSRRWLDDMRDWAQEHRHNGSLLIEEPWVKNALAEMVVDIEVLKLLNYRVAWMLEQGKDCHVESAMIKTFGSELHQRHLRSCMQILGQYGLIKSKYLAPFRGWMARLSECQVQTTFAGGSNEILKDIVANMGLGMPRSR